MALMVALAVALAVAGRPEQVALEIPRLRPPRKGQREAMVQVPRQTMREAVVAVHLLLAQTGLEQQAVTAVLARLRPFLVVQ